MNEYNLEVSIHPRGRRIISAAIYVENRTGVDTPSITTQHVMENFNTAVRQPITAPKDSRISVSLTIDAGAGNEEWLSFTTNKITDAFDEMTVLANHVMVKITAVDTGDDRQPDKVEDNTD